MGNLTGFDARQHEPTGFDVMQAGEYDVCIIASELKPTKKGDGKYLQLTFQVLNGEYKNRKLFDRLNIENPNSKAVEIAKGTLSAICRAVGIMDPNDSAELHNIAIKANVRVVKDQDGNFTNEIRGYKKRAKEATTTTAPTPPMPAGQIAPPLNTGATVGGEARNPF